MRKISVSGVNQAQYVSRMQQAVSTIVGKKQVLYSMSIGECRCIILAADADAEYKKSLMQMAKEKNVEVILASSKKEMGELVSIDIACGVVGVVDKLLK